MVFSCIAPFRDISYEYIVTINTMGTLLVWFVIRTCTMDKSRVMYHLSLQGEGQVVRYIIHLWSLCIIITYSN